MIRKLQAVALAMAFLMLVVAPGFAADSIVITNLSIPGTVQVIGSDSVTLDVNGQTVIIPSSMMGQWQSNGSTIVTSDLAVGQNAVVLFPTVSGTFNGFSNGFVTLNTANGNLMIPVASMGPDVLASNNVYVRLENGDVVYVPLRTAIRLNNMQAATLLTELPANTTVVTLSPSNPAWATTDTTISTEVESKPDSDNMMQDGKADFISAPEDMFNGASNFDSFNRFEH